jgi:hypothetical protein
MDAIGKGFPGVGCYCNSDPYVYENIIWQDGLSMPTKAELDAWIADDIKADMWDAIKAERDRRKNDGGYKVGTKWYHSDTSSRIQQLGLVMMGAGLPANLYWKTMDSSFVLMTQTLALQIFQTAAASDMAIFTVAEQKKAAMLASATPATYDYLTGWPLIYGE